MVQVVLDWQTFCFVLGGRTSQAVNVTCSVPQGSVLGPLLFILYTANLADLAFNFGVNLHAFADDNQLHVRCNLSSVLSSEHIGTVHHCHRPMDNKLTGSD